MIKKQETKLRETTAHKRQRGGQIFSNQSTRLIPGGKEAGTTRLTTGWKKADRNIPSPSYPDGLPKDEVLGKFHAGSNTLHAAGKPKNRALPLGNGHAKTSGMNVTNELSRLNHIADPRTKSKSGARNGTTLKGDGGGSHSPDTTEELDGCTPPGP